MGFADETGKAGAEGGVGYFEVRVADDANDGGVEKFGDVVCEIFDGGFREREEIGIFLALEIFPAESVDHAGFDAIGIAAVPMIVETPDNEAIFFDEGALFGPDGVGLGHFLGNVEMAVEGGLVGDDEIEMLGGGALEDIESGHHGDSDAGDGRIGIAGLEGVDGFRVPGNANVLLDGGDNFARSGSFGLRGGDWNEESGENKCGNSPFVRKGGECGRESFDSPVCGYMIPPRVAAILEFSGQAHQTG